VGALSRVYDLPFLFLDLNLSCIVVFYIVQPNHFLRFVACAIYMFLRRLVVDGVLLGSGSPQGGDHQLSATPTATTVSPRITAGLIPSSSATFYGLTGSTRREPCHVGNCFGFYHFIMFIVSFCGQEYGKETSSFSDRNAALVYVERHTNDTSSVCPVHLSPSESSLGSQFYRKRTN